MKTKNLDEFSFLNLLRNYGGLKRIFDTTESYLGFLSSYVAILLLAFLKDEGLLKLIGDRNYGILVVSISAGILGIVISALAIITSLSDTKLVNVLIKEKIFHNFLFPFYFSTLIWVLNIIISLLLFLISYIPVENNTTVLIGVGAVMFIISFVCFFWGIFNTMTLVGITIRYITYGNKLLNLIDYIEPLEQEDVN